MSIDWPMRRYFLLSFPILLIVWLIENCVTQKGLDAEEIYRALAVTAAHLHLMIRNENEDNVAIPPRRRCYPIDDPLEQKNVRMWVKLIIWDLLKPVNYWCLSVKCIWLIRLTGKVETLMCLMFPLRASGDEKMNPADELFQVIQNVLQTYVHHDDHDCSARWISSPRIHSIND